MNLKRRVIHHVEDVLRSIDRVDDSKQYRYDMIMDNNSDKQLERMTEKMIDNAIEYITDIFKDNADGHDLNHSIRVYKNAVQILNAYPDADSQVVELAALLHDVDDHKLFNTVSNANARKFLMDNCIDSEKIELICDVINSVSFSKNKGVRPKTIEGCIVQDADRLDALGAIGIARTFAYGGRHGRSIEDSVEHFHEKLLLIKDMMNTSEAKKLANERHAFLEAFIEEMNKEIQIK